jgi:arylsulfatase A-like enzyme
MGSHRPYGTGEDAVSENLDRKAEASGGRRWFGSSEVTDEERALILERYRDALGRVDGRIERLLGGIDAGDPVVAFSADHGEEFGEEGYYYHQGYRRRVPDSIIRVPVVLRDIGTVGDRCSLLDLAPTLAGAAGIEVPGAWDGNDLREERTGATLTVAPWHETATVAWQDFERKVIARDADVSMIEAGEETVTEGTDVPETVERQLRDLGYSDAG